MFLNKIYSGIGSRDTPENILSFMVDLAKALDDLGYKLRSGGAIGADTAFETGSNNCEIFRPKHATPEAIELASKFHPAWHRCNDYVRRLHGRNSQIILGEHLDIQSDFVVCWTYGGNKVGGTALGMRIAEHYGIPIYNLFYEEVMEELINKFMITKAVKDEEAQDY